jgi:hypothetical protein
MPKPSPTEISDKAWRQAFALPFKMQRKLLKELESIRRQYPLLHGTYRLLAQYAGWLERRGLTAQALDPGPTRGPGPGGVQPDCRLTPEPCGKYIRPEIERIMAIMEEENPSGPSLPGGPVFPIRSCAEIRKDIADALRELKNILDQASLTARDLARVQELLRLLDTLACELLAHGCVELVPVWPPRRLPRRP